MEDTCCFCGSDEALEQCSECEVHICPKCYEEAKMERCHNCGKIICINCGAMVCDECGGLVCYNCYTHVEYTWVYCFKCQEKGEEMEAQA